MKNLVLLCCIAYLTVAFYGCYNNNEEELYPNSSSNCDTVQLTYNNQMKQLFNTRCATPACHVANAISPNLSTYTGVKNNAVRIRVRALEQKSMPPGGPLSDCQSKQLDIWLKAGLPE